MTDFPLKIIVVLVFVGVLVGIYIMATAQIDSYMEDEGPAIARLRGTALSTRIISSPDCLSTGKIGVLNESLIDDAKDNGLGEDCINVTGYKAVVKVGSSVAREQGYCPPDETLNLDGEMVEKSWKCDKVLSNCHLDAEPKEVYEGISCPIGSTKRCPWGINGERFFCVGGGKCSVYVGTHIKSYYERDAGDECGEQMAEMEWKRIGDEYSKTKNLVIENKITENEEVAFDTGDKVDLPDMGFNEVDLSWLPPEYRDKNKVASWLVYGFSEEYAVNVNGGPGRIKIYILMAKPWTNIDQTGGFGKNAVD